MLELLQDVLEDRYISRVAEQRLKAIREEQDDLLDADDFWARADAAMAAKRLDVGSRRGPAETRAPQREA